MTLLSIDALRSWQRAGLQLHVKRCMWSNNMYFLMLYEVCAGRYQHYLESVLEGADEFHEIGDLILRHATLAATNQDLKEQRNHFGEAAEQTRSVSLDKEAEAPVYCTDLPDATLVHMHSACLSSPLLG